MLLITKNLKKIFAIITIGLAINLSACNSQPEQQTGEVAVDTTAGQETMIIDTTSSASYGTAGQAPSVAPDLDTLTYIDKGVQPDEIFDMENEKQ